MRIPIRIFVDFIQKHKVLEQKEIKHKFNKFSAPIINNLLPASAINLPQDILDHLQPERKFLPSSRFISISCSPLWKHQRLLNEIFVLTNLKMQLTQIPKVGGLFPFSGMVSRGLAEWIRNGKSNHYFDRLITPIGHRIYRGGIDFGDGQFIFFCRISFCYLIAYLY